MTYQAYIGPGAHIVEQTLKKLIKLFEKKQITPAIQAALRHLRNAVGFAQGEQGLRRFDDDLLYLFNRYRCQPDKIAFALDLKAPPSKTLQSPERARALLLDALESCLLLNAKGMITSTEVLIDLLLSCLVALDGKEASLGDLLLDLKTYKADMARFTVSSQFVH